MNFKTVQNLSTPDGKVVKITIGSTVTWLNMYEYVSLGDSIAVGHTIDENWEKDYGYKEQYGHDGRKEPTTIVPNSYTDLLNKQLKNDTKDRVNSKSFAHSGDMVKDLMSKLSMVEVRNAIAKANLITICIGANDILQPALNALGTYLTDSNALQKIDNIVAPYLDKLNDDTDPNSYTSLFNKLYEINPNARYVFTNVYNPMKYLHLEEGTEGFFSPLFDIFEGLASLADSVKNALYDGILGSDAIKNYFNLFNNVSGWTEKTICNLNNILSKKLEYFKVKYPDSKFILADTKSTFDTVPDRTVHGVPKNYNDLVNIEFTREFDYNDMDWKQLWGGDSSLTAAIWAGNLISKYWNDILVFNYENLSSDLINQIYTKVIAPDLDPHPETFGHEVMWRVFNDALGWIPLERYTITYVANGGGGTMSQQVVTSLTTKNGEKLHPYTNIMSNAFTKPGEGYRFVGWNTSADGGGVKYKEGQYIDLSSNLVLYAQWSNVYTVTVRHSKDAYTYGTSDTGPMQCYALWINGTEQEDLGAFSNPARTYQLSYGTPIGVIAQTEKGGSLSKIVYDGETINPSTSPSNDARYTFYLEGDTDIHFVWTVTYASYVFPKTSHWDCYVTVDD